ncbi:MAG: transcriptional repressor LexA [Ruminococcaceae bacterium]|nr:transcriptional repressor LexA [Oscillospiraceae bacterium]
MALTEKQKNVLAFIEQFTRENGYPPSVREIGAAVGLTSTATVHGYLERLEKKGYLDRAALKTRAMRVVNPEAEESVQTEITADEKYMEVPIVGRVAAGSPILAQEQVEGYLPLSFDFARNKDLFVLHVKGESMINVGIYDGDLIIVSRQPDAKNGDTVVALIEDEATVKTFYREKDYIRLQPENDTMAPILVKEVAILGKVVGLFRNMM